MVHKDIQPSATVENAKKILDGISLEVEERWCSEESAELQSIRLDLVDFQCGVNGKGINREYALASAYGELFERLQNNFLIKPLGNNDFKFYPDEVLLSQNESKESIFSKNLNDQQKEYLFSDCKSIVALPYNNIVTNEATLLPLPLMELYGSNGLAAGNSFEEAAVQAISEILERHVMMDVLKGNICNSIINSEIVCSLSGVLKNIFLDLQQKGYNIKVYDCSGEQSFPVVCIIILNSKNDKYLYNFGSHPDIRIAIERCFTEVFQGGKIESLFNDVCDLDINLSTSSVRNVMRALKYSYGRLPKDFFNQVSESVNMENYILDAKSNKELLIFLLSKIRSAGYDVYIRDNNFLGFDAVSVAIPGLSEVFLLNKESMFVSSEIARFKRLISNGEFKIETHSIIFYQLLKYIINDPFFSSIEVIFGNVSYEDAKLMNYFELLYIFAIITNQQSDFENFIKESLNPSTQEIAKQYWVGINESNFKKVLYDRYFKSSNISQIPIKLQKLNDVLDKAKRNKWGSR